MCWRLLGPFIKHFLPTLRYLNAAENHDYYEKIIDRAFAGVLSQSQALYYREHTVQCLLYFIFIHNIIFWDERVDHQLLDVIIALCCHNYVHAITLSRSHPGGLPTFQRCSLNLSSWFTNHNWFTSFKPVTCFAGFSLREVMDSTSAMSSCFYLVNFLLLWSTF